VGFGRLGEHFWGFEQQGVTPDIVTMGKPFGNGFPLAAVVCTDEIAASFANGQEYFNTFGGNPVACAAGLAVLDVIEREGLQQHAFETGKHLRTRLEELAATEHGALIGDVRGSGLFVGVEFVTDRATKEPATAHLSSIVTKLVQEHRILTSVDGPHSNVLVMKPPLAFDKTDVEHFVAALDQTMREVALMDVSAVGHTPT